MANVGVGFEAGTKLLYEVTDLYQMPEGISEWKVVIKVVPSTGPSVLMSLRGIPCRVVAKYRSEESLLIPSTVIGPSPALSTA